MDSIINFRPLANGLKTKDGTQIRENTILRSGEVTHASQRDIQTLTEYGVRYIYDFRSAEEVERIPPLPVSLFSTLHVNVLEEASPYAAGEVLRNPEKGIALMIQMYSAMAGEAGRYKPAVEAILAQETEAFLYHCAAGKDRTGIFSAILMMALGFGFDAVKEEYLRIDAQGMALLKARMLGQSGLPENTPRLDFMFTVREEYIDAYLGALTETYGGADAYLREVLGMTEKSRQALRQKYLV